MEIFHLLPPQRRPQKYFHDPDPLLNNFKEQLLGDLDLIACGNFKYKVEGNNYFTARTKLGTDTFRVFLSTRHVHQQVQTQNRAYFKVLICQLVNFRRDDVIPVKIHLNNKLNVKFNQYAIIY
jgi:hypothetical protein